MDSPSADSPRPGLAETMAAARIYRFGAPDVIVIEDITLPSPGDDEVLVRVSAAGVGPWDALVRSGRSWLPQTLPLTLGSDIAGTVERVGASVVGLSVGDRVYGVGNRQFTNGYAQFTAASATMIAKAPRSLSWIEAASAPVVAVTAFQMLFVQAQARAGQNIFVQGGAGSVGAYAIQLAHEAGMTVRASVHGSGTDYVKELGAQVAVDTRNADLIHMAHWADVVIDTVGGAAQDALLDVLKPGGILVSSAAKPDVAKAAAVGVRAVTFVVDVNSRDLATISQLFERGALRTNVGTVLPLREARIAHEMLDGARPHASGKIVLEVG